VRQHKVGGTTTDYLFMAFPFLRPFLRPFSRPALVSVAIVSGDVQIERVRAADSINR
jgi:hypothetical protein